MVAGLAAFVLVGCNSGSKSSGQQGTSRSAAGSSTPAATEDHSGHDHGDHADHGHGAQATSSSMEKMEKGLAALSPEDAQSARQQHICPVSGEMLGAMGTPVKVEVKGRVVWLCCAGCKDKLLADPDKYLAKLDKKH